MTQPEKPKPYDVIATVISQKGTCHTGYNVGDQICFGNNSITGAPICFSALDSIFSSVMVLRFGGSFPWAAEGTIQLACPDAESPVVFELKRVPPQA